jgi:putative lipoprotein
MWSPAHGRDHRTPRGQRRRRAAARAGVALALAALAAAPGRASAQERDPWFGRDKALHFSASAVLATGGYGAGALIWPRVPPRLATGAAVALSAGIGKEILDRYTGGDPSLRDLTWDLVGTATGLAVAWAIDRWVF